MIWYVAVIAIVNLGLGYALGVMLGGGRYRFALAKGRAADAAEATEY
jgi:hypothetical protein